MVNYKLIKKYKKARRGEITTPHGVIQTPVFMPVGTDGSVKSLNADQVKATGSQIILCNTYHLYLRPGTDVLDAFGGIHNFMDWQGPILTDSGGFQVMSLSGGLTKVTEEGVTFKSHIDGSKHLFTPERSMQIQKSIGADIIMAFDQPAFDDDTYERAKSSLERTIRWLDRCIYEWRKIDPENVQSLFGIIQGGNHKELRIESARQTIERNLEGIAIGGETIGYNKKGTQDVLDWLEDILPQDKPRYTMGVGDIDDIFEIVARGIDMFDCVSPTRLARNGALLISPEEGGSKKNKYRLNITKQIYATSKDPIDRTCSCYTCQNYTRGYLTHLFRAGELLAYPLASIHNIQMLAHICYEIRQSIEDDTFDKLYGKWVKDT